MVISRFVTALGAGAAAALLVVLAVGTGGTVGAEDNGDGFRLYCGLGLVPRTVDGLAAWKGGVVTAFSAGDAPTCAASLPSSAALVLRLATHGGSLDLAAVGRWYAALVGIVVAVGASAATARPRTDGGTAWWRAAVVVVPVVPVALPAFSRFFVSTYAEPAGLLGTLAVACGVAALLVTDRRNVPALALTTVGGVIAATAKISYLPVAVVALAVVGIALGRRAGTVVVVATALAVAVPVGAGLRFQSLAYENANVHDIVFTLVLPELGRGVTDDLGLPPEAAAPAGDGFFNGPPLPTAPWWRSAILDRPEDTRSQAYAVLARHPATVARAVGVGLQATTRPDLPYLASGPADPAVPSARAGDPAWSGARQPDLWRLLEATPGPAWAPSALVLVGLGSALAWRRSRWCRAAGIAAVTAVGLVAAAVLGDGYFEVFKHVWLASYVLLVGGLCLLGAVLSRVGRAVARVAGVQGRPSATGRGS